MDFSAMDISVKSDVLVRELSLARKIADGRHAIPAYAHVLLRANEDSVNMTATDGRLGLQSEFPAQVDAAGMACVPARKLDEIARTLSGVMLRIARDGAQVLVRGGGYAGKLQAISPDDFPPLLPPEEASALAALPGAALLAMHDGIQAVMGNPLMPGAMIRFRNGIAVLAAQDGSRLGVAQAQVPDTVNIDDALVPAAALALVADVIGDDKGTVTYVRDNNTLHFTAAHRRVVTPRLADDFPAYERVIAQARVGDKRAVFDRAAMTAAVRRVGFMLPGQALAISLRFSADKVTVSAASAEIGAAAEDVQAAYDGAEMLVGFNHVFLADFLSATQAERVCVRLRSADGHTLWQAAGTGDAPDDRHLHVIMPMSLQGKEPAGA